VAQSSPQDAEAAQAAGEVAKVASGAAILEAHFGSSELEALKTDLLLDKTWAKLNNTYLAALSEAGKIDALIGFFHDDAVKRLQVEHLRDDAEADIRTHKSTFEEGGTLSVGSAALIACLGNSSSNGLADVKKSDVGKQLLAGNKYIEGGDEKLGYLKVAKYVWQEQFKNIGGSITTYGSKGQWYALAENLTITDEKPSNLLIEKEADEAKEVSGPQHRLRRLLHVLKNFGPNWEKDYSSTRGAL